MREFEPRPVRAFGYFFELRPTNGEERCLSCERPICVPSAIWIGEKVPGPFCRPECALKTNEMPAKKANRKRGTD